MPKQAKLSRIKSFKSYTIKEAADIAGVSTATVHNWSKNGLRLMDEAQPTLVRGDDLRAYIKGERDKRKAVTNADTFYCFSCKKVRHAAANMADCIITGNRAKLTALCKACETVVSKPVTVTAVPALSRVFDLTITRHEATL
ncbi:helix-turn-helix domain-containing protein [Planktotalea sp.]|uniref:helix-turn-helix domain-containing protein n=1 Tax=Planktotalea sp. TaxID=2029877 RepID=UPI003D6B09DA